MKSVSIAPADRQRNQRDWLCHLVRERDMDMPQVVDSAMSILEMRSGVNLCQTG